nr:hypothetical protein [uncultured Methanoregula sp.]
MDNPVVPPVAQSFLCHRTNSPNERYIFKDFVSEPIPVKKGWGESLPVLQQETGPFFIRDFLSLKNGFERQVTILVEQVAKHMPDMIVFRRKNKTVGKTSPKNISVTDNLIFTHRVHTLPPERADPGLNLQGRHCQYNHPEQKKINTLPCRMKVMRIHILRACQTVI